MTSQEWLWVGGAGFDGARHHDRLDVRAVDGRVVEVGTGLRPGAGTRVVDCSGGLVAPGFVDAHVHAVQGGLERLRCDLSEADDAADCVRRVAEYATARPDLEWVLGGGWAMAWFPGGTPTRAALDAVVPDRPVFLPNRDHHGAWVNSAALARAGLTRQTPDPPDGRIERDAEGHPSGTLHEGAMDLVSRHLPPTSEADYYAGLLAGQQYLHSLGVTGWQDAIVGAYAGMDDVGPTYLRAAELGDLTASVVGALWWERDCPAGRVPEQVARLVARRAELSRGRFRATSVKIMQDGVAENFTAALTSPYLDRCGHATDNAGHSFVDPGLLQRVVAELDRADFQVHVHAIGDRGAREALDALAALDDPARGRHHLAHLQVVHPDDVPRFARLGVAANIQALWACLDDQMVDLTLPFLGPERARWQYPFGDLARAGAWLGCGSDWPVTTPDPWQAMHVAVNRTAFGASGREGEEAFLPEQALTLTQVFAAYTAGSAWLCHRDDAGRLEPGAVADLVLVDRDPFAGADDRIGGTGTVATWARGTPVHGDV